MSTAALVTLTIHLPLVAWLVIDRFRTANRWADGVERRYLPVWFQWATQGDKITWLHHAAWTALVGLYAGLWSLVMPEGFWLAAAFGAVLAACIYAVREAMSGWHGWDTVGDILGPVAVALLCVWMAL